MKTQWSRQYDKIAGVATATGLVALVLGLCCLFGTFTLVGYLVGRLRTPDWNNPVAVTVYIGGGHSCQQVDSAAGGPIFELRLVAGDRIWYYRTDTDTVTFRYRPLGENVEMPRGRTFEDQNGPVILLSAISGLLRYFAGPLENVVFRGAKNTVAAIVVSMSGMAWGYSRGYRREPDYASEPFLKQVTDVKLWQTLAEYHLAEYAKKTAAETRPPAPLRTPSPVLLLSQRDLEYGLYILSGPSRRVDYAKLQERLEKERKGQSPATSPDRN